jgi:ubiquinone/menaquinone biosynthesis C-methylase UbiE
VSSLALMRWLESAPARYDAGMRALTLGRVSRLHDAIAAAAVPETGARVLEVGCGTGAVTERLVAAGARVTALDQSPEMLEQARARLGAAPGDRVRWIERTASELEGLEERPFDAVVASLCLSEMSASERAFVLGAAARCLRPGGVLVAGDEVRPRQPVQRLLVALLRAPQAALAWLIAGRASRPIPDARAELERAGFRVRAERRWLLGSLALFVAERV